ncbi:uncharacterized protein ACO6RY_12201 [Pungitius sinensis]
MRNLRLLFLFGLASGFIRENVSSPTTISTTDDLYLEGLTSGELSIDDEDGEDDNGSGSGDYGDKEEKLFNVSQTTVSKELVRSQPQPSSASPLSPSTKATVSQNPSTKATVSQNTSTKATVSQNTSTKVVGPTADWFTQHTSPSSTAIPPTTPTKFGRDITVIDRADEDNSLDRWDVSPTKKHGDETHIKLVENEIRAENGRQGRMWDEVETPEEVTSENMWERMEVLAAVIACAVVGFICAVSLLLLLAYRMKKKDEGSYELGDTKISTTAYQKAPTKEFYA